MPNCNSIYSGCAKYGKHSLKSAWARKVNETPFLQTNQTVAAYNYNPSHVGYLGRTIMSNVTLDKKGESISEK
jgi:hypothetical protein